MDPFIELDRVLRNSDAIDPSSDNCLSPYADERSPCHKTASPSEVEHQNLPRGASPSFYLGHRLLPDPDDSSVCNLRTDSKIGEKTRRGYLEKFSKFLVRTHRDRLVEGYSDCSDLKDEMATNVSSASDRPVVDTIEGLSPSFGVNSTLICDKQSAIQVDSAGNSSFAGQLSTDDCPANVSWGMSDLIGRFNTLSMPDVENDNCFQHASSLFSQNECGSCSLSPPTSAVQSTDDVLILDPSVLSGDACTSACTQLIDKSCRHDFIPRHHFPDPLGYCDIPVVRKMNDFFSHPNKTGICIRTDIEASDSRTSEVTHDHILSESSHASRDQNIIFSHSASVSPNVYPKIVQHCEATATTSVSDKQQVPNKPFFDPTRIFSSTADSTGLRSSAVNGQGETCASNEWQFRQTSATHVDEYPKTDGKDYIYSPCVGSLLDLTDNDVDLPGAVHERQTTSSLIDPISDSSKSARRRNHEHPERRTSDRPSQKLNRRQNKTSSDDAQLKKSRGKFATATTTEPLKDDHPPPLVPDTASTLPKQSVIRPDRASAGQPSDDRPKGRSRFQWSSQKSGPKKSTGGAASSKECNDESFKSTQGKLNLSTKWWGLFGRFCRDAFFILRNILLLVLGLILITLEWLVVRMWRITSNAYSVVNGWWRRMLGRPPVVESEPSEEPFDLAAQWRTMNQKETLAENIPLPETGEEAMKRLFAGHGKDPYSILGLRVDCTDEQIRKYYRRQAVLVHPDKNREPGAEEAFKILNQAFDMIGEPEKRGAYDAQSTKDRETDAAMNVFADLLSKLKDRMKESMDMLTCETCGGTHKRIAVDRSVFNARFCNRCAIQHPVKEGDVWAESSMLGFLWKYYACMENQVYDITKLASCQRNSFKHLKSNDHLIRMRISTGRGGSHQPTRTTTGDASVDELLNSVFRANGLNPDFSQFGAGAGAQTQSSGAYQSQADRDARGKQRQKKKKRK